MPRQFIDLSIYLENDVISDPPAFAPKIEYFTHENTVGQIERFQFYDRARKAYACVATGERSLYACVILKKGVL